LHEVQLISSILFRARINRLESIRRAMVPGERPGANAAGASDYLPTPHRTNPEAGMGLWPYEVTFHCFTAELGATLEAIERAPYGFVVKSITSDVSPDAAAPVRMPDMQAPPGRRTNAPPAALTTVVNEKLLRVTLRVEVIKPEGSRPPGR
jgi:hypothetical protein